MNAREPTRRRLVTAMMGVGATALGGCSNLVPSTNPTTPTVPKEPIPAVADFPKHTEQLLQRVNIMLRNYIGTGPSAQPAMLVLESALNSVPTSIPKLDQATDLMAMMGFMLGGIESLRWMTKQAVLQNARDPTAAEQIMASFSRTHLTLRIQAVEVSRTEAERVRNFGIFNRGGDLNTSDQNSWALASMVVILGTANANLVSGFGGQARVQFYFLRSTSESQSLSLGAGVVSMGDSQNLRQFASPYLALEYACCLALARVLSHVTRCPITEPWAAEYGLQNDTIPIQREIQDLRAFFTATDPESRARVAIYMNSLRALVTGNVWPTNPYADHQSTAYRKGSDGLWRCGVEKAPVITQHNLVSLMERDGNLWSDAEREAAMLHCAQVRASPQLREAVAVQRNALMDGLKAALASPPPPARPVPPPRNPKARGAR